MKLAVLTYPNHFHITQLAIEHALKNMPDIKTVFLIWDDTHGIEPNIPHYLLRKKFFNTDLAKINWSSIIPRIEGNNAIVGNVGQQIIKLHLDLVIEGDFIILDGDTVINSPVDPVNILYSNRLSPIHSRYNHINHALGILNYEFWTNTFMYVKPNWLSGLREHVKHVNGKPLADVFEYADGRIFPVYEWEILAQYILNILKIPKRIEYFDKKVAKTDVFEKNFSLDHNFVLDGSDDFSLDFLKKWDILIDDELLKKLNYRNIGN